MTWILGNVKNPLREHLKKALNKTSNGIVFSKVAPQKVATPSQKTSQTALNNRFGWDLILDIVFIFPIHSGICGLIPQDNICTQLKKTSSFPCVAETDAKELLGYTGM